jgi:hypothetical protein
MAELDVSGTFLITSGRGAGPETWVIISVNNEDGTPKLLNFRDNPGYHRPAYVFIALSAMFGVYEIPLDIAEIRPLLALGFYGLRVEINPSYGLGDTRLESTRPSTLGIVIDDGADRGQALACSCGGAEVTSWFADRTQTPPDK